MNTTMVASGASSVVARRELFELLSDGVGVTMVSAPAGSGKTVLLRSWIDDADLRERTAWVAVEPEEGFVEAGLAGTLTLAGVPGGDALAATLLYRLVSYWLPLPAGGVAHALFRRRYEGLRASAQAPNDRRS